MLGRILVCAAAASALLVTGAAEAKQKKTTTKPSHIYSQTECMGMKSMHWDDATHTCQKNPKK